MNLFEFISELKQIDEEIPNINDGGCGIFAERLYHILKKLRFNPTFVVTTNDAINMKIRIAKNIDTQNNWKIIMGDYNDYPFIDHIVVSIGDVMLDSEGVYVPDKHCEVVKNVPLETIQRWNKNKRIWSTDFNRNDIKLIEKKLEACYKKANNNLVISKI